MKRLTFALVIAILAAGCSSMRIQTDFSEDVDFSSFETFQYVDSDMSVAEAAPLAHDRIVAAIRQGVLDSGLQEVATNPDVYVTYYASVNQEVQFQTTYTGVGGWGRWGRHGGARVATSTSRPVTYDRGTLVMDVWQAAEERLVWRGVATDTLASDPERNTAKIQRGVAKAFADFPPQ